MESVDWRGLADGLGTISWTEHGHSESGGTAVAAKALTHILGDTVLRDAVDYYVSFQPGFEVARSILWMLRPPAAMGRCIEIFRTSDDAQMVANAINLLQVVADRRVLEQIPEILASDNELARAGGIGIVDQLLIVTEEIERDEAAPLIQIALADPSEAVRHRAEQLNEMLEHNDAVERCGGGT